MVVAGGGGGGGWTGGTNNRPYFKLTVKLDCEGVKDF